MTESTVLNEDELDFISEMFNIGVSSAAVSLSQMMNQTIELSIPEIKLYSPKQLVDKLGGSQLICGVTQGLHGPFDARSMLLFPEKHSFDIVRQFLGEKLSDESITELQDDALSEIGNIVINSCITSLSSFLSVKFSVDSPDYTCSLLNDMFSDEESLHQHLLFINIKLTLSENSATGYLVFILSAESFNKLRNTMQQCIRNIT